MSRARRTRRRRVAVVTGTRAEYGLMRSAMEAIDQHPHLTLQTVVTGMHLLRKFGHTVDEIVRDGWPVDARVRMQAGDDNPLDQAIGLSKGVAGISKFLEEVNTDLVVVLGDRIEAMAGALAAVTTGRVLAHVHGGDLAPGDFDESLRHAITKLAHLHLTATSAARRRIIRMGESAERVHRVGAPGLDHLTQLIKQIDKPKKRSGRALILLHPCGRSPARERKVMETVLRAVQEAGLSQTIIYPNSDRGHSGVVEAIEAWRGGAADDSLRVFRSVDRDTYLQMLIDADVLVGNSSSGIIEAPAAGTPSVNIGPRQRSREKGGSSVVDADESPSSIRKALRAALRKRPIIGRSTAYGDGRAGRRIADLLASTPFDDRLRSKINAY
ncbi:MAG: UDP-N-acetylglucosamine 2-epimerase [Phycisphaerae bacterium]